MTVLISGAIAGLVGTLMMDVWSFLAGKTGFVSKPSAALLGRWICCFPQGRFAHKDIRQAPMNAWEAQVGNTAHYLIGVTLGIVYVVLDGVAGLNPANYIVAAGYGLLTCVFAWFVMFPAFGFGVFGRKGASLLRTSTFNHVVFGIGLAFVMSGLSITGR